VGRQPSPAARTYAQQLHRHVERRRCALLQWIPVTNPVGSPPFEIFDGCGVPQPTVFGPATFTDLSTTTVLVPARPLATPTATASSRGWDERDPEPTRSLHATQYRVCASQAPLSDRATRSSSVGKLFSAMASNPSTSAQCAFCSEVTDIGPTGDGLRVLVTRDGQEASQEVFVHVACLRQRLHPSVPFLPSVFGKDLPDD
jgi:hypothetical protein